MRPWTAILLFPAFPGSAASSLRPTSAFAAPGPPVLLFLYLAARGCRAADASVTAAGLLLLVLGLGAGGALASALACRVLLDAPRRAPQVYLVFAAWALFLLVLLLFVTGSALFAGLAVLVWGVVAGTRVLAEDVEPGRSLVASCGGTTGAVVGILLMALLVHGRMVLVMPSPKGEGTLLVRRGEVREPGALVVAQDPASSRLFLARQGPRGLVPEGTPPPGPPGGWMDIGRVFFFFGAEAPWGRAVDG